MTNKEHDMAARWDGVRVAITGGTSGLGKALVTQLNDAGATVAFVARTADQVDALASATGAIGIVGDVGDKTAIYPMALEITANLGGLDVLINNASTLGPSPLQYLADTDCEDIEQAFAVNLLGPFRLTKALYGALAASGRDGGLATVVNISSDAAVNAYETWGAYGLTKAALAHMTAIWHAESAPLGIRFLSVDPGDMNTPLHFAAVPDADPADLKDPADSARELIAEIATRLEREQTGVRL